MSVGRSAVRRATFSMTYGPHRARRDGPVAVSATVDALPPCASRELAARLNELAGRARVDHVEGRDPVEVIEREHW
jgi:hypothetical protein